MKYVLVLQMFTSTGIALTTIPFPYETWSDADQAGKDATNNRGGDDRGAMGYTVVPVKV